MILNRFNVVLLDGLIQTYTPSLVEWTLSIALIAAALFFFATGCKPLPILSKEETRWNSSTSPRHERERIARGLQTEGLDFTAAQHQPAGSPVFAGIAEFEAIFADETKGTPFVSGHAKRTDGHRLVEQLDAIAVAGPKCCLHGNLARLDAVQPKPDPGGAQRKGNQFKNGHTPKYKRSPFTTLIATTMAGLAMTQPGHAGRDNGV